MSTESELKKMLREAAPTLAQVDLSRVLGRSSRRRVAQQVAVGSVSALAATSIGVAGFTGIRASLPSTTSGSASSATAPGSRGNPAPRSDTSTDGRLPRAPAEKINLCGGPLAAVAANESGLVLTTRFDSAEASSDRISGTVTLTNSGAGRITGTSAASPAITLSQNGLVLWHSNGPMIAMAAIVDLAPGASMTYLASFAPVTCAVEDDAADSFRDRLPHVPAGEYQLSAALDLSRQNANGSLLSTDLVTGPTSELTLR